LRLPPSIRLRAESSNNCWLRQLLSRVSDFGNDDVTTRPGGRASEKRQGTKSRREVARWRCRGCYGDFIMAREAKAGVIQDGYSGWPSA
jgi:hypothetical protein